MKQLLLLISMVLMVAGCCSVQTSASVSGSATPEARVAAEKLLDVLNMDENFDNAMRQALSMQSKVLDQMDLSDEEKEAALKGMKGTMKVTMDRFSWNNMKDMFVDIYAEVFTADELNGIIDFYESPAGQKFVEKQPQLMQVTMQKMQGVMAQMMPEIQKETKKMVEQIKAAQGDDESGDEPGME